MAKNATPPGARKNVFKATLTRFATQRGSRGRRRFGGWRKILMHRFGPKPEMETPDPISLAIFAIDRVGPAAVRACASGLEVRVAAPDEATAAVFRAALAQTARRRTTDQLIRIVVDQSQAMARAACRAGGPGNPSLSDGMVESVAGRTDRAHHIDGVIGV
jgi:hypothetical protein